MKCSRRSQPQPPSIKKSGLGGLVLIGKPGPDLFFKVCEYRVAGGEVLTCAF